MSFELENLRSKAERLQLEAHMLIADISVPPEWVTDGRFELAARLYDDAAGYWQAHGGRSLEVSECLALAQQCRRRRKAMDESIRAWYFMPADRKLANGDGREIRAGRTLKVDGPVVLCKSGLHASEKPIDAMQYASSSLVSRVELSGTVVRGNDKLAASERKTLWILDCDALLHEFACRCAVRALKLAKVTDERCWNAIKTKRMWISGKASQKDLDAAWDAARTAAGAAAWDAAWAASGDAAWDAARTAAGAAAWDAAWDADGAAAWGAEKEWQNRMLTKMLLRARRLQREAGR